MAQATTTVDPIPQVAGRDWRTLLELLALGAIWGSSFLFMRIAANPFGPFALVEVRLALGALVLLPFLWRERAHFRAGMWPRLAMIGAINSAIPFLLFAWAAQRSPAAIGAICNAMTVLFAALVGFLFFGQKIGTRRSLALLVGFVGVVVLATSKAGGLSVGGAVVAGSTAALLYGVGVNLVRKHLAGIPPAAAAAATLGCAALLVLPFAATHWPTARIPPGAWGAADRHRRGLHGLCVPAVLPADPAHRPGSRIDGDLPGAAVRRGLRVGVPRRTGHAGDAGRRRADPGQRGGQPAGDMRLCGSWGNDVSRDEAMGRRHRD